MLSWRALFQSTFSTLVMQLAPYGAVDERPALRSAASLPLLRANEAAAVASLGAATAALVVPLDVGDDGFSTYTPPSPRHGGLHPRNKTEFGRRLMLQWGALEGLLAQGVVSSGPVQPSAAVEAGGGSVLLSFAGGGGSGGGGGGVALAPTTDCVTTGGLKPPNASPDFCCQHLVGSSSTPQGFPFELRMGAQGEFVLANASALAAPPLQSLALRGAAAAAPVLRLVPLNASDAAAGNITAVRYAWQGYPLCVVMGGGLPAPPFLLEL